ncbi:hypothetical protein COF68_05225 [Bacillus toyonensis]|uniref:hypothetical protein n=1 Tax=Bacillus toyonensis TaxID=155322 RepID=UPI000BFCA28A|nr:hypothetical protein [Bacillus toyonensis]PHE64246.1 hypothetical protein COF68_05225 [Bacillus toyonensis]
MPVEIYMKSKTPHIESTRKYEVINDYTTCINKLEGDESLDKWCELTGVNYEVKDKVVDNEGTHIITFESKQYIFEKRYKTLEDVPEDAIKCYGVQNHYAVECYVRVNGNETHIFKPVDGSDVEVKVPNINAEWFIIYNGYLVRVEDYKGHGTRNEL